jgi:hypothetical protein
MFRDGRLCEPALSKPDADAAAEVVIHSRFISGTNPGNRIGGHHAKSE